MVVQSGWTKIEVGDERCPAHPEGRAQLVITSANSAQIHIGIPQSEASLRRHMEREALLMLIFYAAHTLKLRRESREERVRRSARDTRSTLHAATKYKVRVGTFYGSIDMVKLAWVRSRTEVSVARLELLCALAVPLD